MVSPRLRAFTQSLRQFLIPSSDTILVAVSGGPDSVCLLHLLKACWPVHLLHVAHLNHAFRPEADGEADFVFEFCKSSGIACTRSKQPVSEICKANRLSKQEGARMVRYRFLEEVAHAQGIRWIAMGHTADDQSETVLINLLRGAGTDGLSGIPKQREEQGYTIIRPMLSMTRDAVLSELKSAHLPFMEDASNQDRRFLRNRIRHELIPLLQTYNPRIQATLVRQANLLSTESDFLEQQLDALLHRLTSGLTKNEIHWDRTAFIILHPAMQQRLVRYGINHLYGRFKAIRFDYINDILTSLLEDKTASPLSLPPGLLIQKTKTELILKTSFSIKAPFPPLAVPIEIERHSPKNGIRPIALAPWDMRLTGSVSDQTNPFKRNQEQSNCVAAFDFDTIEEPLIVRGWEAGDRFTPLGMKGTKKLHDFFVDKKVPREERNCVPLLVCPTGIVWVIGYQIGNRYRITEKTKTTLSLQADRIKEE
jgi:tRNA(Ile)-lysidine synthase